MDILQAQVWCCLLSMLYQECRNASMLHNSSLCILHMAVLSWDGTLYNHTITLLAIVYVRNSDLASGQKFEEKERQRQNYLYLPGPHFNFKWLLTVYLTENRLRHHLSLSFLLSDVSKVAAITNQVIWSICQAASLARHKLDLVNSVTSPSRLLRQFAEGQNTKKLTCTIFSFTLLINMGCRVTGK